VLIAPADEPHEGEALCSSIVNAGLASAVVSEDTDVLVYGATLLRNSTTNKKPASIVNSDDVREGLGGLDKAQFLDLALLCGTDFMTTIPLYAFISLLPCAAPN
jgi:flap endonuclease-1